MGLQPVNSKNSEVYMDSKTFTDLIELRVSMAEILTALGEPPSNGRAAPTGSVLEARHIRNVLSQYLSGQLTGDDVESWANEVERFMNLSFRDGEETTVQRALHTLANPTITRELNHTLARDLLATLQPRA